MDFEARKLAIYMVLYKQRGGAHVGAAFGTWPLGRLLVEPGKITVSVLFGRKSFSPAQIDRIELLAGGAAGLRIFYRGPHWEEFVDFSANLFLKKLLPALAAAGFTEVRGAD